jgi:hypothetical protein
VTQSPFEARIERRIAETQRAKEAQSALEYVESAKDAPKLRRRRPEVSRAERERYSQQAISSQAAFETEEARIESAVVTDPLSVESLDPSRAVPSFKDIEGPAQISKADAKAFLPISVYRNFESKENFVISNYPTLYAATKTSGLDRNEVYDVINLTLAVDAALTIATSQSERRQRELLSTMPKPQAALTIDILNVLSEEAKKAKANPNESQNPVANFIKKWFWEPSINISGLPFVYPDTDWGPIQDGELYVGPKGGTDALISASEMTIRGIGTAALANAAARESGRPNILGFAAPTAEQVTSAWNSTEAGQFDPTMIRKIRENNDPLTVDIMLDFKRFGMMGIDDVEGAVFEKYGDDPRAAQIIDQIVFNVDPKSPIALLGNQIDLAETSNIGNIAGWSFASMFGLNAGDYQDIKKVSENELAMSTAKLATVGITLTADPTLALSRLGAGIRGARYGLAKMTKGQYSPFDPERLEKVFDTTGVRNHYDYLGRQFEEIRNTTKVVDGKTVADQAAQAQKFQTLSSQMRKWYDYNALRTMYDSGITSADDAKSFMLDGQNLGFLLSGQAAKRGKEFTAPHMTKANAVWKAVTFKARGLNPANMGGPRNFINSLYGADVADKLDEDVAAAVARKIEENPAEAGRILSDFAYTDGTGVRRTFLGKILTPDPEKYAMRNRYGWRRKGILTGDIGWFADRVGRLLARIPDTSFGISTSTGNDADLIKQYIQSLGMSRYFANTVKFAWSTWDEPTRIRFVNGLNLSALYSTGVDLVNPQLSDDLARTFATASRTGTQYAPDQIDVLAVRVQAEENVRRLDDIRREMNVARLTPEERAAYIEEETLRLTGQAVPKRTPKTKVEGLTSDERKLALRTEIIQGFEDARLNGQVFNPSAVNNTDNYALYASQLSGRAALFNPEMLNQMMARQSYLNVLLGGGPKMTSATDWWVLATLAGPRFVMRSGLEDFGLYAFTGGQLFGHNGWLSSRRASQAIRESIERVDTGDSWRIRGGNVGQQLGLVTTARRELGTRLARRIPAMRGLILPYMNPEEIAEATAMATTRGAERSREGIANLVASGIARGRFFSLNRLRYSRGEPLVLKGEAKRAADYITDGVSRGYLVSNMERAAETGQHLADGSVPLAKEAAERTEVIDGVVLSYSNVPINAQRVKEVAKGYKTSWEPGAKSAEDVENFWLELNNILYLDGLNGYTAIARSPVLYKLRYAMTRAEQRGDAKAMEKAHEEYYSFVDEYVEVLSRDPEIGRYVLAKELGLRGFAERKLDDALRMMTTKDGRFNHVLYNKLRLPEDAVPATKGRKPMPESERKFGLYYFDKEGNFKYNVTTKTLHEPEIPMPQSVGGADKIQIVEADKIPFTTRSWNRMGRALARLTREPIYLSNYVDMRTLVEPFRLRMVDDLVGNGKALDEATEMADDWAAKTAADRAYDLTMSYVDNPAIRSQLAWQVRNIARFYRALEDFNRRMIRVSENKPETFWKLALTWNVLDDSGFVWEDEFGEKYFMFPGTQVAFDTMNGFLSLFGIQARVPSLPMTWGARVSMIAPSTDPNALVPTLSAPFSAITVKSILRTLPSMSILDSLASGVENVPVAGAAAGFVASPEGAVALEGALFGEYSVNQTFTASLANDTLGPNWKRFIDAWGATAGSFESRQAAADTYIAGASKRAIHALMASGLYDPKKDYTEEELLELRNIADVTAVNETWLRLFMTPLLVATPQSISLDVSKTARDVGIDSGNALWLKYLNRYDSYEDAFLAFTKENPGKAIFTVSKYKSNDYYQMLVETEDFIKDNFDEFKARPTGLSHFAPEEGTYGGINSFYFMRSNGIRYPKTVEEFFNESIRSAGQAELRWVESQAEDARAKAANDEEIGLIDDAEAEAKRRIKEVYPYAEYGIEFAADRAATNARDADEIAQTARYIIDNDLDTDGRAKKYIEVYNQYIVAERALNEAKARGDDDEAKLIRSAWKNYVTSNAIPKFRDDRRGTRFLKILSGALVVTNVEGL